MTALNIPFLTIEPSQPHTHTIVFLHGRGDNARNFAASLTHARDSRRRTLFEALPSFRWVFPQAPTRKCASSPETWPQWFDVWDVRDFALNEELQAVGLREVVPAIRRVLADEAARLGGRWDRLVLAGISMGGATSAHVLFNLDVPPEAGGRLGAFVGFSCRCPFAGRSLAGMRGVLSLEGVPDHGRVVQNTPVLLEHCVDDPLVLVQNGRGLRETLRGYGAQVEWKEYPNGGHWFHSPSGMDDVVDFLSRHLREDSSASIPTTLQRASPDAMDLS
ncbi:alpha/beta-hydrolase [Annulohypoxylon truncatum]|uniref:alpha/beta-hydrolase n=1 Tax=Annulohypoxylon truncatum TaxID=327061 RepID=UPI002007346F|nr:alpha/beta-hydrolase [Annulohypoxylon truncatum]KAI1209389.1 alpha/beta-hydrolase [Annulohypoxylon truncatum]